MLLSRIFSLCLLTLSATASAVTVGGEEFPERIDVPGVGNNLHLSGAAVLDRNFVPFYTAALYVPLSVRSGEQLASGMSPFRMTVIWQIPALDDARVDEYWLKSFTDAVGANQMPRIKGNVDRFLALFGAAEHGQTILFDYIPDAGMRIYVDNKPVGQLAGVEFNRALIAIWLGEKAPREFRDTLLANIDGP
ncbi:chalcone isomerase family protein [Tahibacter amnicola]|uniref:Chalcone isomerase family protein n=1 Tax=Tahibacter amnicola TaxID=2976241 RepID=A0ABY6BGM2_9GAMM|nr:chalcone isomerase family protein [Tahibacter amnicola]UXI68746.1 chalcone isomerase family protein [Tahibacter amnicola]